MKTYNYCLEQYLKYKRMPLFKIIFISLSYRHAYIVHKSYSYRYQANIYIYIYYVGLYHICLQNNFHKGFIACSNSLLL